MKWEQFSSFATCDESEVKVERWNGKIVGIAEFVKGGWRSGYGVCTHIDISENVTTLVVEVVDGEEEVEEEESGEESGENRCIIGMEGGEVEGEVEMGGVGSGEVNGEGVVVNMGREMKKVMDGCEDISILVNVTYGASNG